MADRRTRPPPASSVLRSPAPASAGSRAGRALGSPAMVPEPRVSHATGAHRTLARTPGAAPSPPPHWDPRRGRGSARPLRASGSIFPGTQHIPADSPIPAFVTRFGRSTIRCRGRRIPLPCSPSGRPNSSRARSTTPLTPQAPTPVLPAAAPSAWALASCRLRSHAPSPSIARRPQCCRRCAASPLTPWRPSWGRSPNPLGGPPPAGSSSGVRGLPRGPPTWSARGGARGLPRVRAQPPGPRGHPPRSRGKTRASCPAAPSLVLRSGW